MYLGSKANVFVGSKQNAQSYMGSKPKVHVCMGSKTNTYTWKANKMSMFLLRVNEMSCLHGKQTTCPRRQVYFVHFSSIHRHLVFFPYRPTYFVHFTCRQRCFIHSSARHGHFAHFPCRHVNVFFTSYVYVDVCFDSCLDILLTSHVERLLLLMWSQTKQYADTMKASMRNCGIGLDNRENSVSDRPDWRCQVFIGTANMEQAQNEATARRRVLRMPEAALPLSDYDQPT